MFYPMMLITQKLQIIGMVESSAGIGERPKKLHDYGAVTFHSN